MDSVLPFDRRDLSAEILTDGDVETCATWPRMASAQILSGTGLRPRLSRGLVARRDRTAAALAGSGSLVDQVGRPPPLGRFPALNRSGAWHVRCRHGRAEGGGTVAGKSGPHAPSTVRRPLSTWSTLTQWRGLRGNFAAPGLRSAIELAVRASARPRGRKSKKAVTSDILATLLKTRAGDRSILITASGGRRRSEISALRRTAGRRRPGSGRSQRSRRR